MSPEGAGPAGAAPAGHRLPRVVVASLGNEYRRDDGAGQVVAAAVAERLPEVENLGPRVDPLDLLGCWDAADLAIVVDAVHSGEPPGSVQVVDLAKASGRPGSTSTHGISLAGVLRLAQRVGRAPGRVVAVGIEGGDFGNGLGLSPAVSAAVPVAVARVVELVEEARTCA